MKILVADEKCTHCSGTGFYSSPETNGRHSPLTTDLTAREVNAQRTEADRDFH